ncbi:MAG: DUF3387 domain-containing protein [Sphingobium sp.]|nr:DUF3387 domain-containing protein [Sphingobium sp.]
MRDHVAFYQTIRAALVKSSETGLSKGERDFAVQQLIDRSVVSTEIVDILRAAGMTTPDILICQAILLSDGSTKSCS